MIEITPNYDASEELVRDAIRYTFIKTLEGQELVMRILRTQGASYLDAAIDEALATQEHSDHE